MVLKQRHLIDFFKGSTFLFILVLIYLYDRWKSTSAFVYFGVHGSYGILWCLKSHFFGDRQWDQPCTIDRAAVICVGLLGYWIAPILLISSGKEIPSFVTGFSILLYGIGIFLHFASDMQKYCYLKLQQPTQLIKDGLWSRTRNPNYLGELCIYASFTFLSGHVIPVIIFGSVILSEWLPNMKKKDCSLARYPEFEKYKQQTGLLFPKF